MTLPAHVVSLRNELASAELATRNARAAFQSAERDLYYAQWNDWRRGALAKAERAYSDAIDALVLVENRERQAVDEYLNGELVA